MSNNRGNIRPPIINTNRLINELTKYRNNLAAYKAQRRRLIVNLPGQNIPNIPVNPNAAALARKVIINKGGVPATTNNKAQLNALIKETQALGQINKAAERVNNSALKVNGNNMRRLFGEN